MDLIIIITTTVCKEKTVYFHLIRFDVTGKLGKFVYTNFVNFSQLDF